MRRRKWASAKENVGQNAPVAWTLRRRLCGMCDRGEFVGAGPCPALGQDSCSLHARRGRQAVPLRERGAGVGRWRRRRAAAACYIRNLKRASYQIVSRNGVEWIESTALKRFPWLIHAFTTRRGGAGRKRDYFTLALAEGAGAASAHRNRDLLLSELGCAPDDAAWLRQIHSDSIYVVKREGRGLAYLPGGYTAAAHHAHAASAQTASGDALMTREAGILLTLRTADCLPVLLVDPWRRAVAAVHAGWRGALARIAEKTAGEMQRVFGSNPAQLLAVLGPSIRACCYEVGDEVAEAFGARFPQGEQFLSRPAEESRAPRAFVNAFLDLMPPGHARPVRSGYHLDLAAAVQWQLRNAGMQAKRISTLDLCTACNTHLFFSHRKEAGLAGRMMAAVGVRDRGLDGIRG